MMELGCSARDVSRIVGKVIARLFGRRPPDDFVRADDGDGNIVEVPVVQVWVDPDFPDAHRDPALREWLDRTGQVALIRYSSGDGFCLFPPSRMANHEWLEKRSNNDQGPTHSFAEVMRVLGAP